MSRVCARAIPDPRGEKATWRGEVRQDARLVGEHPGKPVIGLDDAGPPGRGQGPGLSPGPRGGPPGSDPRHRPEEAWVAGVYPADKSVAGNSPP
jgi:hypothetical protein